MQYPAEFPPESRAAVAAEKARAGKDLDTARENLPWKKYGPGQDLEAELRRYILRQFEVFVREACKLGRKGVWHVDRLEQAVLEFLRLATIDATHSKGYDRSGRTFGRDWISNWGGSIQPEVQRQFERSGEWQQFQDALLEVADSQIAGAANLSGNCLEVELEEATNNSAQSESARGTVSEVVPSKTRGATPLGRNLDRLRRECGWSFDEMAIATELDKKLILGHINKGKNAHPSTIATYARTFTEKLGRPVTVADLEG